MIKQPFLISMKNDPEIRNKLASSNKVTATTIQSWLRNEDKLLTTHANLAVIKEHFGLLEVSELLEIESVGAQS
jgi:hypothetical protein